MTKTLLVALCTTLLASPVAAMTLKIATVAPENSDWMRAMRAGASEISKRTEGRVELKFYAGGVMGNDKKVLRKMRIGQLQGGAFPTGSLAERYPDAQLYGLPLLFKDLAEVDYVRARMDEKLEQGFEQNGLVTFGFAGAFAKFMSAKPVRGLADLRGQKVWVPEGDRISYAAMEELGLAPVVLPITDVLTGLQTGLIDIIGTTQVAALVLQWHTKVRYVTDYPLAYIYATMAIEKKVFDSIAPADQAIVRDVLTRVYAELDVQGRSDEAGALEAIKASGIEVVTPDAAETPRWRELTAAVNRRMAAEGAVSKAMLDELLAHLDAYRGGANAAGEAVTMPER